MSEPRRWWISPKLYSPTDPVEAEFYIAYDQKGDPARLEIETVKAEAYDKLAARLAEAEKALQLVTKQLDMHDCIKGSSYFDGEDRVVTDCHSCDEVKRAREYFEKH